MKLPLYLRVLLLLTLVGCAWLFWQDTPDSPVSAPTAVAAKPVAAALLAGEPVRLEVEAGEAGWLKHLPFAEEAEPSVRVTDHPLVVELCLAFGKPLVSTSANLTGLPPCRTTEEVLAQFGNDFPVAVGETGGRLNPSEIRDALTGELFRQG